VVVVVVVVVVVLDPSPRLTARLALGVTTLASLLIILNGAMIIYPADSGVLLLLSLLKW
jgi:hypothetical protein